MDDARRKAARHRVHLAVRYEVAADFVREYVDNLSHGGLFLRGGRGLSRHRDVEVEIELPGFDLFRVRAEVVHVIDDAEAAEHGRVPGAGLQIVEAPDGFADAMASYLARLGRRADATVLCTADQPARLIAAAGYQVTRCADPRKSPPVKDSVAAVVVPAKLLAAVEAALPTGMLIVAMDRPADLDRVLTALDARL